jgi:hypothetical protein
MLSSSQGSSIVVPIPPIPQPLANATHGTEHARCAVLAVREIVDLAPEVPGTAQPHEPIDVVTAPAKIVVATLSSPWISARHVGPDFRRANAWQPLL